MAVDDGVTLNGITWCSLGFLLVVLFAVNFLALLILRVFDLARFLWGDLAVGARLVFHFLHVGLAFLQARGFFLIQFARLHAGINTLLLLRLARVDACTGFVAGRFGRSGWGCGCCRCSRGLGKRKAGSKAMANATNVVLSFMEVVLSAIEYGYIPMFV